jgi:hypothetical protein
MVGDGARRVRARAGGAGRAHAAEPHNVAAERPEEALPSPGVLKDLRVGASFPDSSFRVR